MILAEDSLSTGENVLVDGAGLPIIAQCSEVVAEVVGGGQGVGVVLTQDATLPTEELFMEAARLFVIAQVA